VAVLGFSLVAPIFPLYVLDLGASYTLLGLIISIYGAVQLITQVPAGRLSDRIGRKPLILAGLLSFGVMPPLYIYATSADQLIPIRIVGGIGASMVWPAAMALAIDMGGVGHRGRAMGWYNAAFYSALAVGPAVGGALYDLFGLAAPFHFWTLLALISFLIVLAKVKEPAPWKEDHHNKEDGEDVELVIPGYGVTFLACCGVVMWSGIIGGFNITLLPAYAERLGLSITEIGLLYLAYAGATAVSNVYFGEWADRGKRKYLITGGCIVGVVSFILLNQVKSTLPVLALLAALGLGSGISTPAAAAVIADVTSPFRRGEIFGIFNTARMMGVVVGPLVAGLTADVYGIGGAIAAFGAIALLITAATVGIKDPRRDM
jgi:DHA1 family multidrug resistance protein-like MFS transporter